MARTELERKIRHIEISTRRLVDAAVGGEYRSVFRGRGIEYDSVRPYLPGDDVRTIDWNVTSRAGDLFVKQYVEERELTVLLVVDVSASLRYGSCEKSKEEVAAEIAAIVAFSAIRNNDRVGALLFSDRVERFVPPRKGIRHVQRMVKEILDFRPEGKGTDLGSALTFAGRMLKKRGIVFVLSDFYGNGWEAALRPLARRHDLVAVVLGDEGERELPRAGWVHMADGETGDTFLVPTHWPSVRKAYRKALEEQKQARSGILSRYRVDQVEILADADYEKPLHAFFRARARRAAGR